MNIKDIIDSKKILISLKCNVPNKINLVENDNIVSDDDEIAETFKIFFEDAVKNFNMLGDSVSLSPTFHLDNPVDIAVEKFKNHPSITLLKVMSISSIISFSRRQIFPIFSRKLARSTPKSKVQKMEFQLNA